MNEERIEELAALHAAGALDGPDLAEWQQHLVSADAPTIREAARFQDVAALAAICLVAPIQPPADLKARIMNKISTSAESSNRPAAKTSPIPPLDIDGFKFVFGRDTGDWISLRVPGASVKLLSLDPARGYAVVLGKLEAGASYPPHKHINTEQVYVVTGDLHIGTQRLGPGDFHQADGGTTHDVNYSETGCTILAIISTADLEAQMA